MVELTPELLKKPDFLDKVKNIIKNGDPSSLTAGQIRNDIEKHYGLEKDALKQKSYKKMMNEIIDKTYTELQDEQKTQEHTPAASDSSREASPVKPFPQKRKAASPEQKEKPTSVKKAKMESNDEKVDARSKKTTQKKKQLKQIDSDNDDEDEKMKDASDQEEEEEADEHDDVEEEEEADENDFATPHPATKKSTKSTKKATKSTAAMTKDEESVKRLKQFINKCGVRKVWARELKDCESTAAEVRKLKAMLEELGVHGRPTLEKCEAVKKERELKAELDSLDTSLIINESSRRTRTRNTSQSRPSYAVDASSSDEEEEDEEDEEDESVQGEASTDKANESGNESDTKVDNAKEGSEEEEEEEESSDDEFQGDESDEDA